MRLQLHDYLARSSRNVRLTILLTSFPLGTTPYDTLVPCRRSTLCPFQSLLGAFSTLQVTYRGVLERLCCWEAAFWHPTSRYGAVLAPHIALESEPPCLSTGFTGNKGVNVISLRIDVARSASGRWNDGVSTVGVLVIHHRLNSFPPLRI